MADPLRKLPATPDEARAEIERARMQIASSAAALKAEVQATADWRGWVRRRPELFIAGAFAIGFFIGTRR